MKKFILSLVCVVVIVGLTNASVDVAKKQVETMQVNQIETTVSSKMAMSDELIADGFATDDDKKDWIEENFFHKDYNDLGLTEYYSESNKKEKLMNLMIEFFNMSEEEKLENLHEVKFTQKLFSADYYEITMESTDAYYYGDLKNNKPTGLGILIERSKIHGGYVVQYVGEFKTGYFQGYGALNNTTLNFMHMTIMAERLELAGVDEETVLAYESYLVRKFEYEGNFVKGEANGKGTYYEVYNDSNVETEGYRFIYAPTVITGKFNGGYTRYTGQLYKNSQLIYDGTMKNNECNSSGTLYREDGTILYSGKWSSGKRKGKGTSYYENGNVEYTGVWKKDVYHGSGTLYTEEGELEYKGKFKNGDYTS